MLQIDVNDLTVYKTHAHSFLPRIRGLDEEENSILANFFLQYAGLTFKFP
jgi:hypothetical protein